MQFNELFLITRVTHTCVAPFVSSSEEYTNGMRFMKGSNVVIKNGTIKAISPMSEEYDDGCTVTIADNTVKIIGEVEYTKSDRCSEENFFAKTHIYIPSDYTLAAPAGFEFKLTADGTQKELVKAQ